MSEDVITKNQLHHLMEAVTSLNPGVDFAAESKVLFENEHKDRSIR